jgi:hypothetical protein
LLKKFPVQTFFSENTFTPFIHPAVWKNIGLTHTQNSMYSYS